MSAKAVREYHGKKLIARHVAALSEHRIDDRSVLITPDTDLRSPPEPWLTETKLVVKPDQLIKRRGKAGLVGINLDWPSVVQWISESMGKEQQVEQVVGVLDHFIVEPCVPHQQEDEYYLCIHSNREGEEILFTAEGGVDVGDVDAKAQRLLVPIDDKSFSVERIVPILNGVPEARVGKVASFLLTLLNVYRKLNFVYMEINPLVYKSDGRIAPLDLAAKLDETAAFLNATDWGHLDFPAPFGRIDYPEESYIRELDSKTGASLKLTILNPNGRIWTMVAGGGASVVYADTISDLGYGNEIANYGEYSGAPSTDHTYEYAKTLIGLMTKEKDPRGKIFLIGGGIANFTDVAATFTGLIKAIHAFQEELKLHNIQIWVRRAGPNYQEGLQLMRTCGKETDLPIHIYGPETHVTAIVPLALGLEKVENFPEFDDPSHLGANRKRETNEENPKKKQKRPDYVGQVADHEADHKVENFTAMTRCVVYGLQNRAVQGMLDFDFMCKRAKPSVAAMIFPFAANHFVKFYWGTDEILMPVYQSTEEALSKHKEVTVVVNFASFRSVYDSVMEILEYSDQIKTIAIIAEGVPESQTRAFIKVAREVGGVDEYQVCEALKEGRISKPMVAWCIGTCASIFPFEVQFGHAGALAHGNLETARAKNQALKEAGAHVPENFFEFGNTLKQLYQSLVDAGTLVPRPEPEPPKIPMDYSWAKRLGLVRKPAQFISSISDDRGEELTYSGMPISEIFEKDLGIGGVLSLLWFRRQLPPYATKFIEMILMITADHGPAVSGAHNTIVATRAGKDLVSSLASGLLTIGPRFGGALDDAAIMFTEASDAGLDAEQFVKDMRKQNKLVMGIGHRIKSLTNPDKRVEIIKKYALENFSGNTVLEFALAVEQVTTKKKANLILNVDGCIAVCFVDMLRTCGAFSNQEADEIIKNGSLNGLFVLGRSMGFIGHFLDQRRLKQGLYRHPWDDISYLDATDV
ncbi:citryl-CoA lyase [Fistulifera solaris]|uniref:ATP citrate synthase n=1 Tax=Fistulifera solaris TaxID=1519565 RepID=A0A1Z5JJD1_FISSO|nr:citryl-CoA lyase [Fistulifera solaris]|eukprot:GAX13952.1 citryl-CoA lyase [Fistulifera solaris]